MINYFFHVFTCLVVFSCTANHQSDIQQAVTTQSSVAETPPTGDTLPIDLSVSAIYWKGTKMRGAGKHEGVIDIRSGYLLSDGEDITGGKIVIDMNSIQVTDIPKHEPVPRKRLTNHLKSDDFFAVDTYPVSRFEIKNFKRLSADSVELTGNMTIRNITKQLVFTAFYKKETLKSTFLIDRFAWNIAYKGNWIDKTLVDKNIQLKVRLHLLSKADR